MGAVEPEQAKPTKQTYRAVATVFGVEPGQTFERVIPPEQEARLLASGAIKRSTVEKADVKPAEQTPATTKEKE